MEHTSLEKNFSCNFCLKCFPERALVSLKNKNLKIFKNVKYFLHPDLDSTLMWYMKLKVKEYCAFDSKWRYYQWPVSKNYLKKQISQKMKLNKVHLWLCVIKKINEKKQSLTVTNTNNLRFYLTCIIK